MPELAASPARAGIGVGAVSGVAAVMCVVARPSVASVGVGLCILAVAQAARADAATHRIPNRHLGMATLALSLAALASGGEAVSAASAVGIAWLAVLLGLHLADPSLGFGDVKLGAVLGLMLGLAGHASGWTLVGSMLASSTTFLAGAGITLATTRRRSENTATPFAPGLVLASTATVVVLAVSSAIS